MHGVIAELFSQLTKELCAYLGQALPRLSDNWWKELSFQQVQIVDQHRISELPKLELEYLKVQAQLMRVRMVFCDQLPETRKYRAALCGFKACP